MQNFRNKMRYHEQYYDVLLQIAKYEQHVRFGKKFKFNFAFLQKFAALMQHNVM